MPFQCTVIQWNPPNRLRQPRLMHQLTESDTYEVVIVVFISIKLAAHRALLPAQAASASLGVLPTVFRTVHYLHLDHLHNSPLHFHAPHFSQCF